MITTCSECPAELGVERPSYLIHHEDGSHTAQLLGTAPASVCSYCLVRPPKGVDEDGDSICQECAVDECSATADVHPDGLLFCTREAGHAGMHHGLVRWLEHDPESNDQTEES